MSVWMAGGIVLSGVIGAGAAYLGNQNISESTDKATKATAKATTDTNALLQRQYDQTRADNQAWRDAGETALQEIQNAPDFKFESEDFDFFKDPSYDFVKQEGINALDRSAASRGRVLSGAQDRAVTRYGSNLASQEYGNAFNRHQQSEAQRFGQEKATYNTNLNTQKSLAGIGQSAVNATTSSGNQMTNALANNTMQGSQQQNALAMNNANMYNGIAQSSNQMMGNFLLAKNAGMFK